MRIETSSSWQHFLAVVAEVCDAVERAFFLMCIMYLEQHNSMKLCFRFQKGAKDIHETLRDATVAMKTIHR